jgi:hypothetical protein
MRNETLTKIPLQNFVKKTFSAEIEFRRIDPWRKAPSPTTSTGQNMDGFADSQCAKAVPSRTVRIPPPMNPSRVFFGLSWKSRDRCYDFKNIFAEKLGKNWRF